MRVSIVTPVLNGADYLKETINSIRDQTLRDIEHIIVDGGSTDGTIEIAENAAEEDDRVRLIVRPRLGQYAAVDYGFEQAAGDMLGWLNADDLYLPWALDVVSLFCERTGADWVTGLPSCWDAEGRLRFIRPDPWRPRALIRRGWAHKDLLGFIQQESTFFSARLYRSLPQADRHAFATARLAGDFILWKAMAASAELRIVPSLLAGFRRHGANRSTVGLDAYMAEARAAGATDLPRPVVALMRALMTRVAAGKMRKLVEEEDRVVSST